MFNYSKYNLDLGNIDFGSIKDCSLLMTKAQILRPYVAPDNVNSDGKLRKYYNKYGYHFGVDLVPHNDLSSLTKFDYSLKTYSPCMGVVIDISQYQLFESGYGRDSWAVVIQYDANTSFRVANLSSVSVNKGDDITQGDLIGISNKYVHFEMLKYYKEYETAQTYTFNKLRLFLANPMQYFNENYSGLSLGVGD